MSLNNTSDIRYERVVCPSFTDKYNPRCLDCQERMYFVGFCPES